MPHIKLVCTIGPASESTTILRGLLKAGVDAFRINLSHTSPKKTEEIFSRIRSLSRTIPIIIDTQGKEIRMWAPDKKPLELKRGDLIAIAAESKHSTGKTLFISNPSILAELKPDTVITLDDNRLSFRVISKEKGTLRAKVIRGGFVQHPKNIRLEKKYQPKQMLTERDRVVLAAVKRREPLSEVSLSYVADANDVREARRFVGKGVTITSKIETRQAVENLDELLKTSDVLMIDRNDLGTEIGYEKIPLVQKFITSRASEIGKPVFVATHLLESMVKNDKPTRGEVNDIVNLVLDGVSGLILSSESAVGKDPVQIFKTLKALAAQGEFILSKKKDLPIHKVIERLKELNYL